VSSFFFFNDTATTEIYTLSLHDALPISGDQIRSWCYIDDLVDGVCSALVTPSAAGEDFNLGNPRNTLTIYELAKRVVSITGSTSKIRFVQTNYADIDIRVPYMEKARQLLGFEPQVDIDEGIRRTAVWCHAHLDELSQIIASAPAPVATQGAEQRAAAAADARVSLQKLVSPAPGARPRRRATDFEAVV